MGPTSAVLLENIPSDLTWREIKNILLGISDKVEGDYFWVISTKSINGTFKNVEGRPFGIKKHKIDSEYYYSQEEIEIIKNHVGFNPKFYLGICAMCNRDIDHKILGELTLYLAEKFDGIIDFEGHLTNKPEQIKGKIWEIPYETAEGITSFDTIADVDFMRAWLGNKNFKMIK